jgi:hypothetical protein
MLLMIKKKKRTLSALEKEENFLNLIKGKHRNFNLAHA